MGDGGAVMVLGSVGFWDWRVWDSDSMGSKCPMLIFLKSSRYTVKANVGDEVLAFTSRGHYSC